MQFGLKRGWWNRYKCIIGVNVYVYSLQVQYTYTGRCKTKEKHQYVTNKKEKLCPKCNLAKPALVDDIEELLEEPGGPMWEENEIDVDALIAVVSIGLHCA